MGKNKLQRYAEIDNIDCVIQPAFNEVYKRDHKLKGNWNKLIFNNNNPIILELGCGKGEYSIALAEKYRNKNFIGVDIKGDRIWRGGKTVVEKGLDNVVFLRIKIEFINSLFDKNEVSEIWITFPDPQKKNTNKRLNSPGFLNRYKELLIDNGIIHLKTDSLLLYLYNQAIIRENDLNCLFATKNLYSGNYFNEEYFIKTFYEKQFLKKNKLISYQKFKLPGDRFIREPENFIAPGDPANNILKRT